MSTQPRMSQVLPKTELAVMFHILLHLPDSMFRWNAVRNFWGFFCERYFSYPRPGFCARTCMWRLVHMRERARAYNCIHTCVRADVCAGPWGGSSATSITATWPPRI